MAELVGQGADIVINISASPYTIDKRNLRTDMLKSLARSHRKPVVYVNQVGGNDSLVFDGSSMAVLPDGRIAAQAKSFEEDLVIFDTETGTGEMRIHPAEEIEAAYLALVCGTRDYVRKCGFEKAIVGLSGGVDSAVVAAIAHAALGAENVMGVAMPGGSFFPWQHHGCSTACNGLPGNSVPGTAYFWSLRGLPRHFAAGIW